MYIAQKNNLNVILLFSFQLFQLLPLGGATPIHQHLICIILFYLSIKTLIKKTLCRWVLKKNKLN